MKRFPRIPAAVAAASLALTLAACTKPADDAAKKDEAKPAAEAAKDPKAIPGLETERERVSYMVGQDIAKTLEPIKDEVDIKLIAQAIEESFAGKPPKITDEQANEIRNEFGQKLQKKRAEEAKALSEKNVKEGETFLAANGKKSGVVTTKSGLQYQVLTEGKGAKPKDTDTVRVHYKGTLLDGKTFDSSYDRKQPAEFILGQVVPGWSEGVALMPVGSKYKFWIPSKLAYGESGAAGVIGPNATLVFEVELLDIVKPEAEPAKK